MAAAPFAPAAFAAWRNHPQFFAVAEDHARANLDTFASLSLLGRWLVSDLGRSALTGAALVLDGFPGGLTAGALVHAAITNRSCSRGRALAYLRRCELNDLIVPVDTGGPRTPETPLVLRPQFLAMVVPFTHTHMRSAARLAPEMQPALEQLHDEAFRRRLMAWTGIMTASRPDLFAGPDMPIDLFLDRDGGSRILDSFLVSQPAGRRRMLERAPLSRSALARASFVSRTHVMRLLEDGERLGLLKVRDREISFSPELSDDVERHYALIFETARTVALAALNG